MFRTLMAFASVLSPSLMAADGSVNRTTLEKDLNLRLTITDDRPTVITLDDKRGWSTTYKLRFEGTYGSAESFANEYFEVVGHPSRSSRGEGKLKVVVSYVSVKGKAQIGGLTLHGDYGVCVDTAVGEAKCKVEIAESQKKSKAFDGKSFFYSLVKNAEEPFLPVVTQGNEREPFCTAAAGLKSLENASCTVSLSDIYAPLDKWFVMFFARDLDSNFGSGSSFSPVKFGEADGNGILLDKKQEPGCVREKSCVHFAGYLKYWRGKKSYFVVQLELEEGRPRSAVAYGLDQFGGTLKRD